MPIFATVLVLLGLANFSPAEFHFLLQNVEESGPFGFHTLASFQHLLKIRDRDYVFAIFHDFIHRGDDPVLTLVELASCVDYHFTLFTGIIRHCF